jgi:hypothetical protein
LTHLFCHLMKDLGNEESYFCRNILRTQLVWKCELWRTLILLCWPCHCGYEFTKPRWYPIHKHWEFKLNGNWKYMNMGVPYCLMHHCTQIRTRYSLFLQHIKCMKKFMCWNIIFDVYNVFFLVHLHKHNIHIEQSMVIFSD